MYKITCNEFLFYHSIKTPTNAITFPFLSFGFKCDPLKCHEVESRQSVKQNIHIKNILYAQRQTLNNISTKRNDAQDHFVT